MKWRLGLLLLLASTVVRAEVSSWHQVSSAQFITEQDGVAPGQKISVGLDVHLANGWHTYWINPGDSGSAVKLTLTAKSDAKSFDLLTGPIQFPMPERYESGPITSFVYNQEVLFIGDVVIPDSAQVGDMLRLHLDAEWLVCKDVCIPAFDSFELNLPVRSPDKVQPSQQAEKFLFWRGRLPRLQTTDVEDRRDANAATLTFKKPVDFSNYRFVDFFPLRGAFLTNGKPRLVHEDTKRVRLRLDGAEVGRRVAGLYGLMVLDHGSQTVALQWGDPNDRFQTAERPGPPAPTRSVPLLWFLLSAFVGGLILNLMPCVFPVLSIKLMSLVEQSEKHPAEVRVQNMAYVVGVVLSFLAVGGLLAALRRTGELVGWGFQLQSPIFVLLLAWLFFLLALQMFGWFEINWLNPNWGGQLTRKSGWVGAFFTGVLAVVVASPCTAPFMGAAVGVALAQPIPALLSIFLMLGLGLAFPYLLFAIFPKWGKLLPRPGAWMQRVKEFFAFPLLLTCVWLVWLLAQLRGNLTILAALTGMVAWAFVIWLRNRYLAGLFSVLIVGGGWLALSQMPKVDAVHRTDSVWMPFSRQAIERQPDETVFVDFTADWCLTCKVNERLVFSQAEIMQFLHQNGVRLVRGDWTSEDAEITKFLNNYQRAGVPFYIAFGPGAPDGRIFPELLTPEVFRREMEIVLKKKGGSP